MEHRIIAALRNGNGPAEADHVASATPKASSGAASPIGDSGMNDPELGKTKMPHSTVKIAAGSWSLKPPRVDPAQRKAELDAILASANAGLADAGLNAVGQLSIAEARDDDDYSYFLQLRSEPLDVLNGWEFRFDLPLRSTGQQSVDRLAAEIVAAAKNLLRRSKSARSELERSRQAVARILKNNDGSRPVELVALGVAGLRSEGGAKLVADVRMLGVDLSVGIERVHGYDTANLVGKLERALEDHRTRSRLVAANRAAGVRCHIDQVAQRLLEVVGIDPDCVFETLARERQLEIWFGGEEGVDYAGCFYWEEGVVRGDFEHSTRPLRLQMDTLLIPGGLLPSTVLMAAEGRQLGKLLEHPLLPADCVVTRVSDEGEWVYIDLSVPTAPFAHPALLAA